MRVGILGGGQLGRMLALAGYPLGITCEVFDPAPDACAGQVAPHRCAPFDDLHALAAFAEGKQCITYEFENVSPKAAEWLATRLPVRPTPRALAIFQDRLTEREFLHSLGIPVPAFAPIEPNDPERALQQVGLPAIVKTRRFGYDGKGQWRIDTEEQYLRIVRQQSQPLLMEALVAFETELSIIGVRSLQGDVACYPLIENIHGGGILRYSFAPARVDTSRLQPVAERFIATLFDVLGYVGVLTIELFLVGGRLLVNEVAPRVHNSGHWTIEGAETSQFENHLRAILGLPLGSTTPRGYCLMANLIGELPDPRSVLTIPNAHLHLYGKQPHAGRKLGHITLRYDTPEERVQGFEQLQAVVPLQG